MFKELFPLLRQRAVLLSVTRAEDDHLRVNVFPKKLNDSENQALTTPLSVTGTAEELDTQLASALTEYVGAHLGLSSSLETAKEQMAAAAKTAKNEAKSKADTKTLPAKTDAAASSPVRPKVETTEEKPVAATPVELSKPETPRTASLFDFAALAPATPSSCGDAEEEEEIMAEIEAETNPTTNDIAA